MSQPTPSPRFAWLEGVREHQAKQERIRRLRAELAAARAAGKAARHAERLRRIRAKERAKGGPPDPQTRTGAGVAGLAGVTAGPLYNACRVCGECLDPVLAAVGVHLNCEESQ